MECSRSDGRIRSSQERCLCQSCPARGGLGVCLSILRNLPRNAGFNISCVGRECHAQDLCAPLILASSVVRGYRRSHPRRLCRAAGQPCRRLRRKHCLRKPRRIHFRRWDGRFDGLENGDQFTELLQTGHVGLYEHNNAIVAAEHPPSILQAIESVFTGTGPGQAELGQVGANYFTLPPSYGYYQAVYIQNGLHPTEANVNTPSDSVPPKQLQKALKLWREYVDAARTAGIATVAPVAGPNGRNEPKLGDHVFATNPYYALERGEALYGRAIAFDVPPNFFLTGGSGPGYQKFIVQAIQWGNEHGLRTTMLLSPFPWPTNAKGKLDYFRQFTTNTFSADTQAFVSYLSQQQAIPSEWSVDNYEDTYPHDTPRSCPKPSKHYDSGWSLGGRKCTGLCERATQSGCNLRPTCLIGWKPTVTQR